MKKLIINTLAILLLHVSVLNASSVDFSNSPMDLVENSTILTTNTIGTITPSNLSSTIHNLLFSIDKRKILIKTKDNDGELTSSAVINFVDLSGMVIAGPYTLNEGEILEVELEAAAWEIDILEATEGAIVEYWYDE